jgi:hypothetical protein
LRKLILNPWLVWYIVKTAFIKRNQTLSRVCNAAICFHHAIEYDLQEARTPFIQWDMANGRDRAQKHRQFLPSGELAAFFNRLRSFEVR